MRKITILLVAMLILNMVTSFAFADNAGDKLGRGIADVVTSPFELFKGMGDAEDENGIIAGFTTGLLKGVGHFFKRLGVGVYEIVTFPIPKYTSILTDPEYFLEK